jgi:hypothetical protein
VQVEVSVGRVMEEGTKGTELHTLPCIGIPNLLIAWPLLPP